jgi:hypothetical protein
MEWLTKLGITKKVPGNPLAWEWASKAVQDAMRVPKWMEYEEWVRELVFSDTEAGGYLKRYLVEQGSVCRALQRSKKGKKSVDVEEAGKRSICQWLLWTLPPKDLPPNEGVEWSGWPIRQSPQGLRPSGEGPQLHHKGESVRGGVRQGKRRHNSVQSGRRVQAGGAVGEGLWGGAA